MVELMTRLNNGLREIAQEIPDINSGGCGVFSLALWDELLQLGILTEPVVFKDDEYYWNVFHIALKWKDYYFDCDGIHGDMKQYGYLNEEPLSLEKLREEVADLTLWNAKFDRGYEDDLKRKVRALGSQLLMMQREMDRLAVNF